ncbi:MAG: ATP-binding protein [Lachnospiraceae bacterium]
MSLKKRIFRSNMKILSLALASLLLVAVVIIGLFEDAFLKDFESVDNAKLDTGAYQVMELVDQAAASDWQSLETAVNAYEYVLLVLKDGQVVYGREEEPVEELLQGFDVTEHMEAAGVPELFYHQKSTVVGKYEEATGEYIMAIHLFQGDWLISSFRNSFTSFGVAFLLAGAAVIAVLLLLSSFFTKRMVKKIMEPMDALVAGTERVQAGNLTEQVVYHGDGEFEKVCGTFNTMQEIMLADQQQRLKNEKARTDMVTGISHDLRTPLTSIRGYIKGVLDGVADTPEKKKIYLETAYESTEEMNQLLQKLFDFSRLESGQMPLHLVRADLAEFADAYIAQKEVGLDPANIEIRMIKEAEAHPEIRMDVEQMRRIFDNLLENSIKYAQTVPTIIQIHMYEEASGMVMEWSDNGPGVPEDTLESIFDRFYWCDEARTKQGNGVGLYVVKYIVEQHGGQITARNEEGLRLRLWFPKEVAKHENTDC